MERGRAREREEREERQPKRYMYICMYVSSGISLPCPGTCRCSSPPDTATPDRHVGRPRKPVGGGQPSRRQGGAGDAGGGSWAVAGTDRGWWYIPTYITYQRHTHQGRERSNSSFVSNKQVACRAAGGGGGGVRLLRQLPQKKCSGFDMNERRAAYGAYQRMRCPSALQRGTSKHAAARKTQRKHGLYLITTNTCND